MSIYFNETTTQLTQGDDIGNEDANIEAKEDGTYEVLVAASVDKGLSDAEAKEFKTSEEARELMAKGIVTEETLDAVTSDVDMDEELLKAAALKIAENQGDPAIDEIIQKQEEFEDLINDVVDDHREEAEAVVESFKRNILPGTRVLSEAVNRL